MQSGCYPARCPLSVRDRGRCADEREMAGRLREAAVTTTNAAVAVTDEVIVLDAHSSATSYTSQEARRE
jgi:hypothetical protein